MQVRLTLEYDGSNYSGWQIQDGQDSIQARIEDALARIFGEKIRIRAAGRTDAGVHALGQVAAFRPPRAFDLHELSRALNAMLPPDIVVIEAMEASDDFDPRRDARSRLYEYRILNQSRPSAFEYRYAWLIREPLDLAAMNDAAARFAGEHDFASFRTLGTPVKSTVRRVLSSFWSRQDAQLIYRVEATSFLRHMVRTMVATMVEVGRGRLSADVVDDLLARRDRALAPASAPACGLFLLQVRY
jgi:tRNA pseudouridine38-40 synthase